MSSIFDAQPVKDTLKHHKFTVNFAATSWILLSIFVGWVHMKTSDKEQLAFGSFEIILTL